MSKSHWWFLVPWLVSCAAGADPPRPDGAGPPSTDVDWRAETIAGRPAIGTEPPTLRFGADGRVGGNTGCNALTGSVEIDPPALRFGPLATTRRACEPPLMEQEQRFSVALGEVRRFEQEGRTLVLRDAAGVAVMRLSRGDATAAAAP